MNRRHAIVALAGLVSRPAGAVLARAERRAVVSHIDHFIVEDSHPEELFGLFTDQFRLPTIWPMTGYGSFRSGGVYFGNVVVEVGHYGDSADTGRAQWAGIVFAPRESADASAAELVARHIPHGPATPYLSKPDGGQRAQVLWSTVRIRDPRLSGIGLVICDYHFDVRTGINNAAADLGRQQGGPLGLLGVKEVLVAGSQWNEARARWRNLLAPATQARSGAFSFATGPAIHLVPGEHNAIRSLALEVGSLERAKVFLSEQAIAYDADGSELAVRQGLHGLPVRLVQRREHSNVSQSQ